ncbi:hypothetical protein Gogos_019480 [Gossypium gossypioides]|uniref:Uncharacterized protein n=1 Tax=Gossypium gossypioides TaxID=34282 RepID=A0A7J9BHM6_GOSGO|nr:hypothetical protein [Gossypium gossypioides]
MFQTISAVTGMEFDNFGADGRMGHHTSRNVPFKLATLTCTTSPLPAKEELSSGILTFHGLEQLCTDRLSSSQGEMNLTLL